MPKRNKHHVKETVEIAKNASIEIMELLNYDLSSDKIKRRCFIRHMANLGEALKAFQKSNNPDNPILQEIQELKVISGHEITTDGNKLDSLILAFKRHRNNLLHDYVIEHLTGNEDKLTAAQLFAKEHCNLLITALDNLAANEQVSNNSAICFSVTNKAPADESPYNIHDYALLAAAEIDEFNQMLRENGLSNEKGFIDVDKFKYLKQDDKYFLPALLNYLENSCSLLKQYNGRYKENSDLFDSDDIVSGNQLRDNSYTESAYDFLINVHDKRRHIAHSFQSDISPGKLIQYSTSLNKIKNSYLSKAIPALEQFGYKANVSIYSGLNAPAASSSSSNSQVTSLEGNPSMTSTTSSPAKIMSLLSARIDESAVNQSSHLAVSESNNALTNEGNLERKRDATDLESVIDQPFKRPKPASDYRREKSPDTTQSADSKFESVNTGYKPGQS
jgi:hypothetical protein